MTGGLAALAENRRLVRAAAAASGLMFAYMAGIYAIGDPRLSDGKLTAAECPWGELVLISVGLCSTLLLWGAGAAHAWTAKRFQWFLVSIVIWPLAIVYALFLDTGGGKGEEN